MYKIFLTKLSFKFAVKFLVAFQFIDINAFNKNLTASYRENDPHFDTKTLVNDANNAKFSPRENAFFLYVWKQLNINKKINIVDFGGGAGGHYFSIKNTIGDVKIDNYLICEIPFFEALHQESKLSNKIHCSTFEKIKKKISSENIHIDILLMSGTIQYLKNYKQILASIIKDIKPDIIILQRTPCWTKRTRALIQSMGHSSNALNAAYFFNETELDEIMSVEYVKNDLKFGSYDRPWVIPYGRFPFKTLCYEVKK